MAAATRERFEQAARGKVETFEVESLGLAVDMRHPLFSEWHRIVSEHRALDGVAPPADLMIRTVAAVLVNPDGSRMFPPGDVSGLDELSPAALFELYTLAWSGPMRGPEATEDAKKA